MNELHAVNVPALVLISGPIASGKSTVAMTLAARARAQGLPAASIDMDEVVAMVAGADWSLIRQEDRELASQVAAVIAERCFVAAVNLVLVAGSTLSSWEWDRLLECVSTKVTVTHVLLKVSLVESVRRAQADPGRELTKDATYVERIYDRIAWGSLRRPDIEIDTDNLSLDEVVSLVAAKARAFS